MLYFSHSLGTFSHRWQFHIKNKTLIFKFNDSLQTKEHWIYIYVNVACWSTYGYCFLHSINSAISYMHLGVSCLIVCAPNDLC